jgi:hypothetical protein
MLTVDYTSKINTIGISIVDYMYGPGFELWHFTNPF